MTRQTIFSPCRNYRYALWREWIGGDGYAMFVGLNPSTADETQDDPTIRRCIAFAKAWGYSGLCMTNLFAFRATDPRNMRAATDPVGPQNDAAILELAAASDRIICAWGTHGAHLRRGDEIEIKLRGLNHPLFHLGLTKAGAPTHPLYISYERQPVLWARLDARHAATA